MKTSKPFLVLLLAACAACSSENEPTRDNGQASESADDNDSEPSGKSTATPDDPAPDVGQGAPASADELCAEVEGVQGGGLIPPDPGCEGAECGASCDPCAGRDDCEPPKADAFACNRHLLCVPIED